MATILITGCRSGIGYQTVLAFGRRGDTVYATMRDPSLDHRLRDAVARESWPVVIRKLDVTDGTAIRDVVASIVAERAGIDVLVSKRSRKRTKRGRDWSGRRTSGVRSIFARPCCRTCERNAPA